jgi:hypothetical protein
MSGEVSEETARSIGKKIGAQIIISGIDTLNGLLTISSSETASSLTVTATSGADTSKSGTAAVAIISTRTVIVKNAMTDYWGTIYSVTITMNGSKIIDEYGSGYIKRGESKTYAGLPSGSYTIRISDSVHAITGTFNLGNNQTRTVTVTTNSNADMVLSIE